jgi:signal peptidase I
VLYVFANNSWPAIGKTQGLVDVSEPQIEETTADEQSRRKRLLPELVHTLMLALVIFLTARLLVLPYQVDGRSMAPNLEDRDRVLVNRAVYLHVDLDLLFGWIPGVEASDVAYYPFHSAERGDIVVLNPPQYSPEPFIKRAIGIAGDVIDIKGGFVFVNGVKLDEPYIDSAITDCGRSMYCDGFVVPEGSIFVLGDNRQHSFDSRSFGPVPLDNVIGKAWFSNWPVDRIGVIPHYNYGVSSP